MRRNNLKSLRKFERLEDRRMMVGDIDFENGVFTIDGGNYDDRADVRIEADSQGVQRVFIDLFAKDSGGDIDDHDDSRPLSNVTKIVFNGFAGNDELHTYTQFAGVSLDNLVLEFHGGTNDDRLINPDIAGGIRTLGWGDAGNDSLEGGKYNDVFEGGTGDDSFYAHDGSDTFTYSGSGLGTDYISERVYSTTEADRDRLDFSNLAHSVNVNLAAAYPYGASTGQYAVNFAGTMIKLSSSAGIEDVIGSAYEDTITGNSRPNHLKGGNSGDDITGAAGNDTLEGGAGNDTYVYSGSSHGTDTIVEAAKADTDTLDFSNFGPTYLGLGVSVNIEAAYVGTNPLYAVNTPGTQIKLNDASGIENVIGSAYADTIIGNARDNYLFGGNEDDEITGGKGNDKLEGARGDDIYHFAGANLGTDEIVELANASNDGLRFSGMSYGITVDLALTVYGSGYAVNEPDFKLKLSNDTAIERVWGTDYDDVIFGNSRDNHLMGRGGYDNIFGFGGADYLHGGNDIDWLYTDALDEVYGGLGYDFFNYWNENGRSNPDPAHYKDWGVH
jgi:Ca2+-binding RTX toxin-like protein